MDWFKKLDRLKNEIVKTDVHFYIQTYERLKTLYEKLSTEQI